MDAIRLMIKGLSKEELAALMAAFNEEEQCVLFKGTQFIACFIDAHRTDLIILESHNNWAMGVKK